MCICYIYTHEIHVLDCHIYKHLHAQSVPQLFICAHVCVTCRDPRCQHTEGAPVCAVLAKPGGVVLRRKGAHVHRSLHLVSMCGGALQEVPPVVDGEMLHLDAVHARNLINMLTLCAHVDMCSLIIVHTVECVYVNSCVLMPSHSREHRCVHM